MSDNRIAECPSCGQIFTLEDIVGSSDLEPVGMGFVNSDIEANMFHFRHVTPDCGAKLRIPVQVIAPHLDEPIPESILTDTDQCDGHCRTEDDWAACTQNCYYAPFRRFLITLVKRKWLSAPPV